MIAVTIGAGNESYKLLARLAAESCAWSTGLETIIIGDSALARYPAFGSGHQLKFRLFDLIPHAETILYFDSDTLFLRPHSFAQYENREEFLCVRDAINRWSLEDSSQIGIPVEEYFNSGLMILNRKYHAPLLEEARSLYEKRIPTALHDQGYLNAARWRSKIPTVFLPHAYNTIDFNRNSYTKYKNQAIVGHFNGMGGRSATEIEDTYAKWSHAFGRGIFTKDKNLWGYRVTLDTSKSIAKRELQMTLRAVRAMWRLY